MNMAISSWQEPQRRMRIVRGRSAISTEAVKGPEIHEHAKAASRARMPTLPAACCLAFHTPPTEAGSAHANEGRDLARRNLPAGLCFLGHAQNRRGGSERPYTRRNPDVGACAVAIP